MCNGCKTTTNTTESHTLPVPAWMDSVVTPLTAVASNPDDRGGNLNYLPANTPGYNGNEEIAA